MEETTKLFESVLVIIHGLCFERNCPQNSETVHSPFATLSLIAAQVATHG